MASSLVVEGPSSSEISERLGKTRVTDGNVRPVEPTPFQPYTTRWRILVGCLPLLKLCYGYKTVRD